MKMVTSWLNLIMIFMCLWTASSQVLAAWSHPIPAGRCKTSIEKDLRFSGQTFDFPAFESVRFIQSYQHKDKTLRLEKSSDLQQILSLKMEYYFKIDGQTELQEIHIAPDEEHRYFQLMRSDGSLVSARLLYFNNFIPRMNDPGDSMFHFVYDYLNPENGQLVTSQLNEWEMGLILQKPDFAIEAKSDYAKFRARTNAKNLRTLVGFAEVRPKTLNIETRIDGEKLHYLREFREDGTPNIPLASDEKVSLVNWRNDYLYYWYVDIDGKFNIKPAHSIGSTNAGNYLDLFAGYRPLLIGGFALRDSQKQLAVFIDTQAYDFFQPSIMTVEETNGVKEKVVRIFKNNLSQRALVTPDRVALGAIRGYRLPERTWDNNRNNN